jgi:hypothetical protein
MISFLSRQGEADMDGNTEWYVYAGMFHDEYERYTYHIGTDGAYAQVVFEETQHMSFDYCGIGTREVA